MASCALDRISSYTVSLIKRHYSIDDVLSRVSSPLQVLLWSLSAHSILRGCTPTGEGCQTVTITEFLAMVRVLRPSLHVTSARRWRTVGRGKVFSPGSAVSFEIKAHSSETDDSTLFFVCEKKTFESSASAFCISRSCEGWDLKMCWQIISNISEQQLAACQGADLCRATGSSNHWEAAVAGSRKRLPGRGGGGRAAPERDVRQYSHYPHPQPSATTITTTAAAHYPPSLRPQAGRSPWCAG